MFQAPEIPRVHFQDPGRALPQVSPRTDGECSQYVYFWTQGEAKKQLVGGGGIAGNARNANLQGAC